jgi:hypothetical protein
MASVELRVKTYRISYPLYASGLTTTNPMLRIFTRKPRSRSTSGSTREMTARKRSGNGAARMVFR